MRKLMVQAAVAGMLLAAPLSGVIGGGTAHALPPGGCVFVVGKPVSVCVVKQPGSVKATVVVLSKTELVAVTCTQYPGPKAVYAVVVNGRAEFVSPAIRGKCEI